VGPELLDLEMKAARMDAANRALCYAHRNPPKGVAKTPYRLLKTIVKMQNRKPPTVSAMSQAAASFLKEKQVRGRKKGWRKTSKAEDRKILAVFKENRPPGCGIDSRNLHDSLPKKLRAKIVRRTLRRRLADKGIKPRRKLCKNDPSKALCLRRVKFAKKYEGWTKGQWRTEIQAVGDIKQFTYYPRGLYSRFKRLRASWTYMTDIEKYQSAFLRPKKWFPKKEWKLTRPQKIFGMTTSSGKVLAILIPSPFDAAKWKGLVKSKLTPFLKRTFPHRRTFKILLDSEQVFHAPEPKQAYREGGIEILPGWPKYSPELNPQENAWPSAESALREKEGGGGESFEQFQKYALASVREYKGARNLVGGMVHKIEECLKTKGSFISS
jgi:hypothetical protein